MPKLALKELRQYLEQRSREELADDIVELYKKLDAVKDYYSLRLKGSYNEQLVDRSKATIRQAFFPGRGFGEANLSLARKAVSDYRKVSSSTEGLIDLMLFYVEMGVQYTNTYGDIDEPFYQSLETMYTRAAKLIVDHSLNAQFETRCRDIVGNTAGIGWGFHDSLNDAYHRFFNA